MLKDVYDGIVLKSEAVECSIMFVYGLYLECFFLVLLIYETFLLYLEFAGDNCLLESYFQVIGVVVLPIFAHLFYDQFLCFLECAF